MIWDKEWSVLVVDDQVDVVTGVIASVHWQDINVKDLYKAYSAMDAKTVLLQNKVDIMLCDIEMPLENGLQLLKWARDKGMDVECIFLTAHADFLYARSALLLGSFDYILQPARYVDIENAILRAEKKIIENHELKKYYSYGKTVFEDKYQILDGLLLKWYLNTEDRILQDEIKEYASRVETRIVNNTPIFAFLLDIFYWRNDVWERELFRYSCVNILEELLQEYDMHIMMICLKENLWCGWILSGTTAVKEQEIEKALQHFGDVSNRFFSCELAIYMGGKASFYEIGEVLRKVDFVRKNNVAQKRGFFRGEDDQTKSEGQEEISPDFQIWETLLVQGDGNIVYEEAVTYLNKMAELNKLDSSSLKNFYNDFVRVLFHMEERAGAGIEDIFISQEQMECYLNAYTTVSAMKTFLEIVTCYFTKEINEEEKAGKIIQQVKEYVYHNLDKDIHRDDIAMEVFLNPSYLSRLFKKKEGISLKEFIAREKMKTAKILLKDTSLPVSIIALKVGYSNFSHFSQIYKKIYGISPTDDRK